MMESESMLKKLAPILTPEMGHRIREIRIRAGLTQTEVGALIGIDQTSFSRIEHFGAPKTVIPLGTLCQALRVPPEDLIA